MLLASCHSRVAICGWPGSLTLVPKRHFTDLKTDARVLLPGCQSFRVLEGPKWLHHVSCRFASRSRESQRGAVDAGGSDQDMAETALVQNVNRRLDL